MQDFIHWLGAGAGGRVVRRAAWLVGALALTLILGWKQFRGARSETTLLQADIGWQLGTGHGFTTRVKFPKTAAWLEAHGEKFAGRSEFPALSEPPLYPMLIGATIAALPANWRAEWFGKSSAPPEGFGGDYLLLALNLALFWLGAWLTHSLAKRLFGERMALIATLAVLLSAELWSATVAINGMPLMMVLGLGLAHALVRAFESNKVIWWAAAGGVAGLMFLGDYPAGAGVLVVLGGAGLGAHANKARNIAAVGLAFALVVAPWVVRNLALTGSPVGLAWQEVALRSGDPTAEPNGTRTTYAVAAHEFSLSKFGNKGLSGLEVAMRGGLWAGGMILAAFFLAGLFYRFRDATSQQSRWTVVALLGLLIMAHSFFGSGEGERLPAVYLAPLLIVFGAGFFSVLIASDARLAAWAGWWAAALLALQAVPLAHDALEPRRTHFSYPPYFPGAFTAVRQELAKRTGSKAPVWMTDVPAGAAWYGGGPVWAMPATLADFQRLTQAEELSGLLLTPHTLDRPFFTQLAAGAVPGQWSEIYAGLAAGRLPATFPLRSPLRVADGLVLLVNPLQPGGR